MLSIGFGARKEAQQSNIHLVGPRTLQFAMDNYVQTPLDGNEGGLTRLSFPGSGINSQPGEVELPSITTWMAIDPARSYSPVVTLGDPEILENIHLPIYQSEADPDLFAAPRSTQPPIVSVSDPVIMRDLVM
ncbi:MAG: hypothetical protein ACE5D1_06415, partial [Fidelibacterota bacterium]